MKVFSNECTFDYSWEEVSTANWRKYCPWNEKSTHVIAVDIVSRQVDPATGIVCLHTLTFFSIADTDSLSVTNRASHHMQTERAKMAGGADGRH